MSRFIHGGDGIMDQSSTIDRSAEVYWHDKHPCEKVVYRGRPLPTGYIPNLDVRDFVTGLSYPLRSVVDKENLRGMSVDTTVERIHAFVAERISYTSDQQFGKPEFWLQPTETLEYGRDDCEGGANLLASLFYNALPRHHHWRLRVCAGTVKSGHSTGGHAWCAFLRSKDNEWVAVDWCYWSDHKVRIDDRRMLKERPEYISTWWSNTYRHSYSHKKYTVLGRVSENIQEG
jgi:hypothetical protein